MPSIISLSFPSHRQTKRYTQQRSSEFCFPQIVKIDVPLHSVQSKGGPKVAESHNANPYPCRIQHEYRRSEVEDDEAAQTACVEQLDRWKDDGMYVQILRSAECEPKKSSRRTVISTWLPQLHACIAKKEVVVRKYKRVRCFVPNEWRLPAPGYSSRAWKSIMKKFLVGQMYYFISVDG